MAPSPADRSAAVGGTGPRIIAHRGVPGSRPENTLAGFELALTERADGIELDVHGTRDGVVVVHHDFHLQGDGERPALAALGWTELRRLAPSAAPVPTLAEVLELVDGRATLYVEVKAAGIEQEVATLLRGHEGWCAVHSFDHRIPRRIQELEPTLPIGLLSCSYPLDAAGLLRSADALTLWQSESLIDAELVRTVHDAGCDVVAWTVNHAEQALRLAEMGVDAICTDRPGELRAIMAAGLRTGLH